MKDFGARLKQLRTNRGMSIRELAILCETSKSSISMYESGERRPKYETLEAIADVFNVDMEYLLGKTDVKNRAANELGFDSLEEAESPSPEEPGLSEGELELIELFRKIPEDQQNLVLSMIRAAVGNK